MNEEKIEHQYFTREQMRIAGQINVVIGALAITGTHMLVLVFGFAPLDLFFQGILFSLLVVVGLLYYRLYQKTKEIKEE